MQGLLNSFHKNLRFTGNRFENELLHFLANKMWAQGLTDYHKNTSTEQYGHYDSLYNGFPRSTSTPIIKGALNKSIIDNHTDDDNNAIKFY